MAKLFQKAASSFTLTPEKKGHLFYPVFYPETILGKKEPPGSGG
jgi:hypothetical protein